MNSYNEHTDYKLTDLDYLTGDHHLQMMKAALPFLNVPQQRTLSMFVKIQELKNTFQLFEDGQTAAMGICSLDQPEMPCRPPPPSRRNPSPERLAGSARSAMFRRQG